jgi:hypothetical protein
MPLKFETHMFLPWLIFPLPAIGRSSFAAATACLAAALMLQIARQPDKQGYLADSEGAGTFPAVVELHGCAGMPDTTRRKANVFWLAPLACGRRTHPHTWRRLAAPERKAGLGRGFLCYSLIIG